MTSILPLSAGALMRVAGVIEMIAGIAISLVTTGHYFDVAVRDMVMAAGAFTLARISETRNLSPAPVSV